MLTQILREAHSRGESIRALTKAAVSGMAGGGGTISGSIASSVATGWAGLNRQTSLNHHAEQYRHNAGTVHSAIRPIAQRIARQPLRVARARGKDEGRRTITEWSKRFTAYRLRKSLPGWFKTFHEDLEVLEDHPILRAVSNPNPIMTRWTLISNTVFSLEITGKGYWWVRREDVKDESSPVQIWPLPSSWIEPVHKEEQLYHSWIIRFDGSAAPVVVPASEIVYFHYPDPSHPLGAFSPLQAQARPVIADESILEAQRKQFGNGIWPGLAVILGRHPDAQGVPGQRPVLTKEQRSELVTAVKQAYRGVQLMDEPMILDGMIEDVKKISNTPREMDFMNSGQYTQRKIDQGFGVNPIVKGQVEGANRASSATADDHFCATCVNPKIELLSECLTKFLAPLPVFGGDVLVYIEEAESFDPDLNRANLAFLKESGALSINEQRAEYGLPPIHGGDCALIPIGMQAVQIMRADKPYPAGPAPSPENVIPPVTGVSNEDEDEVYDETSGGEDTEDNLGGGTPPDDPFDLEDEEEGEKSYHCWATLTDRGERTLEWLKVQGGGERNVAKSLNAFYEGFLQATIRRVTSAGPEGIRRAFDEDAFASGFKKALEKPLVQTAVRGAELEWRLFRPIKPKAAEPLPLNTRRAAERAARRAANRGLWDDIAARVRASLMEAVHGVTSVEETRQEVNRQLGKTGRQPTVENTSRTESVGQGNRGREEARKELQKRKLIRGKRWVTVRDNKVRPTHRACEGQTVPAGKKFNVGGYEAAFPCDPVLPPDEKCGCRCTTESVPVEAPDTERSVPPHVKHVHRKDFPAGPLPDYPDVRQDFSYDCGAAAAFGVLKFHGMAGNLTLDDVRALVRANIREGTHTSGIQRVFDDLGMPTVTGNGWHLGTLAYYVNLGWPVLCPVQMPGDPEHQRQAEESGHWIAVIGIKDNEVLYQCPVHGRQKMAFVDFINAWHDRGGGRGPEGEPITRRFVRHGIAVGPFPRV